MAHAPLSRIGELVEKLQQAPCEPTRDLQVREDLEALKRMARRIQAVLNDAEKREIQDELVGLWLKELKGVAYDAEDVLDVYEDELLRAKMEAGVLPAGELATHHLPYERTQPEVSPSAITWLSLDAAFCGKMADEIWRIRSRFEEITKQHVALQLREGGREREFQLTIDRPPSSHFVDAPTIYGRRDDLEKVINQLLCSDECQKSNLLVLLIVGMGGVGKTTLVQHVYHDQRICGHFQKMGWVCVSDDFTVEKLTPRIIEAFTEGECHLKEFSVLQERLKGLLNGKRFLLVLDEVWNEKPLLWESFRKPLRFGARGSAVITTTRNESVAKIMQTTPFHRLDCLSDDDCWALFSGSAFIDRDPEEHPDLIEIGKKIVRKCGGLPLAAKSLGGLLSHENEVDEWEAVLQSDVWDLRDQGDGIIPALRLSYLHLPSYLKQCFLYAAMFPKNFPFSKEDLVPLWMAQGFLQRKGGKQAADVGNTYFYELVQRSFFQRQPRHGGDVDRPNFVMHDLIHDLAQHISEGEFFYPGKTHVPCPSEVRHVSVVYGHGGEHANLSHSFSSYHAVWAIRTFMIRGITGDNVNFLYQMMPHLEFLRALDLSGSTIGELPDSVGNLKLLLYLNLNSTDITELPRSVCKLYNLQTLSLAYCLHLRRLPKDVTNLCNLRYLDIEFTFLDFLPRGIGKLTGLRALVGCMVGVRFPRSPTFSDDDFGGTEVGQVSNVECSVLEELKDLSHLEGTLEIFDLSYVMNAKEARLADLKSKRNIRELFLYWAYRTELPCNIIASSSVQTEVLENLRPPDHLRVLRIHGYGGLRFPSWMADDPSSFSKLVRIEIEDCKWCTSLPPLGQLPSLKHLNIVTVHMVEAVGNEFCGRSVGFPELEKLQLSCLFKWVTWGLSAERGDHFPRLRRLTVTHCRKLESMVPLYLLPSLEELCISHCPNLTSIELWGGPSSSSCSSSSSSSPGLPPLRIMSIIRCPRAHFLPEDDEQLFLPPTLQDLHIDCPSLVEWCERGNRLASIPNANIWWTEMVSTSAVEEECGELACNALGFIGHSKVRERHQGDELWIEYSNNYII